MIPFDAAGLPDIFCNFSFRFCSRIEIQQARGDPGDALLHKWESPRCLVPYFSLPVQSKPMWPMACLRNTTKNSRFSLEWVFGIRDFLYDSSGEETPGIAQWVFLAPCSTSQHSPSSVRSLESRMTKRQGYLQACSFLLWSSKVWCFMEMPDTLQPAIDKDVH